MRATFNELQNMFNGKPNSVETFKSALANMAPNLKSLLADAEIVPEPYLRIASTRQWGQIHCKLLKEPAGAIEFESGHSSLRDGPVPYERLSFQHTDNPFDGLPKMITVNMIGRGQVKIPVKYSVKA